MARISGLLLVLLLVLGGCSPPPELMRPAVDPPDVAARTLLPPGRVEATKYAGSVDGAQVAAEGGGRMIALRFANADAARSSFEAFAKRETSDASYTFSVSMGSQQYVQHRAKTGHGLVWLSDAWIFSAEAASADRLSALIAASGAGGITDYSWIWRYLRVMAGIVVLALVVVVLLLLWLWRSRVIPPANGATAVSREALVARLLALNDASRPWQVRTGPEADLIVEWKYADVTWCGVMSKHGVRELYRLRLYLSERAHRAGALDEVSEIEWAGGAMRIPPFRVSRSNSRGIQLFKSERAVAYGFDTATGSFGKQLDIKFDLASLKQPVIAAITAAGWSYAPVLRPQ